MDYISTFQNAFAEDSLLWKRRDCAGLSIQFGNRSNNRSQPHPLWVPRRNCYFIMRIRRESKVDLCKGSNNSTIGCVQNLLSWNLCTKSWRWVVSPNAIRHRKVHLGRHRNEIGFLNYRSWECMSYLQLSDDSQKQM